MLARVRSWTVLSLVAVALAGASLPAEAGPEAYPSTPMSVLPNVTQPTGGAVSRISVNGSSRGLFKVAMAPIAGGADVSNALYQVAARDFVQSGMLELLDATLVAPRLAADNAAFDPSGWKRVGVEGIVRGASSVRGNKLHVELRMQSPSHGPEAVLKREYDVTPSEIRVAMHRFGNEIVKWFTGTPGSFGSRLVFSATTEDGQKAIYQIESDGHGLTRLPAATSKAFAPSFGPDGVYYAGEVRGGFALFRIGNPAVALRHSGRVLGAAFGANKMALVVANDGQSDIWVGDVDGKNLRKVTRGGLNLHPTFGPGGQLAYVSNKDGNPQVYVDGKRMSWRGTYNLAPVWCNDPAGAKILFMGRDGSTWDIFSVDMTRPDSPESMKRLTQHQGSNTFPACSPDGRLVAFFSSRGGLFTMTPEGYNQQKISDMLGESLRWEGN